VAPKKFIAKKRERGTPEISHTCLLNIRDPDNCRLKLQGLRFKNCGAAGRGSFLKNKRPIECYKFGKRGGGFNKTIN